jgi:CheY-like chemotaxis protein
MLVAHGLAARAQIEKANARAEATGRSLGEVLVEAGVITSDQLERVKARREALEPVGPQEARSVLVVEDEVQMVMALREVLSRAGFRVSTAMNGAEALAQCLTGNPFLPDVILLDLGLPVYRGAHLLFLLREQQRTRNIPVVVLTGRGDPKEETEVRGLGISAYLLKPTPAARLVEAIRGALLNKNRIGG